MNNRELGGTYSLLTDMIQQYILDAHNDIAKKRKLRQLRCVVFPDKLQGGESLNTFYTRPKDY